MNCHGCKWLDRYKQDGNGYCCMVERSQQGQAHRAYLLAHETEYAFGCKLPPSINIRKPNSERCELYSAGDYKSRWRGTQEDNNG